MADPIGLSLGLQVLATSALQSNRALYHTVISLRNIPKTARELGEELRAMNGVLEKLQEMASNTDIDLTMLRIPLRQYGKTCEDLEAVIVSFTAHSRGSRATFKDWAKLLFIGENISGIRNMLAGYKSTFIIALAEANIRTSIPTKQILDEGKDMITNTTVDLEERLRKIDGKLQTLLPLRGTALSDEIAVERQQIQEERESTQQCLNICGEISTQVREIRSNIFNDISVAEGGHHVVAVTTPNDLISAKRVTAGDDSDSGSSASSSASSVTSLVDSVFSMTSGSSKSSVAGPAGAGERLVVLLLSDNQLSSLYQEALKRVSADKFERNFLRLMNKFATELRKEAEDPQQRSIARFVRYRARNSAHAVRNSICSSEKPREDVIPKSKVLHEPINMESDESADDSGPDHEDNTDLQQLEHFIVTSQAFVNLRNKLSSFIYSINEMKSDDEALPQMPEIVQVETFSLLGILGRLHLGVLRLLRPRLDVGQRRLEWQCSCGIPLFGDFRGDEKEIDKLVMEIEAYGFLVTQTGHGAKRLAADSRQTTASNSAVSAPPRSDVPQSIRNPFVNTSQVVGGMPDTIASGLDIVERLSTSAGAGSTSVALCVNSGPFQKIYDEIDISHISRDTQVFHGFKKAYEACRNSRINVIRSWLTKPVDISYIQFAVEGHKRVYPIAGSPDCTICAHTEGKDDLVVVRKYERHPAALALAHPPIPPDLFFHLWECPKDITPTIQTMWLNRLPKKLDEKLEKLCLGTRPDGELVLGWGILVIEGIHKRRISRLTIGMAALAIVISVAYSAGKKDVSSGFAIGALVVACWTVFITALYFEFQDS